MPYGRMFFCLYVYLLMRWTKRSWSSECLTVLAMCSPPGWPLCKGSDMTLIKVSQHAYLSYQAFSLSLIYYHVYFETWCICLNIYLCWIKFCLSLSLSLSLCSAFKLRHPHKKIDEITYPFPMQPLPQLNHLLTLNTARQTWGSISNVINYQPVIFEQGWHHTFQY